MDIVTDQLYGYSTDTMHGYSTVYYDGYIYLDTL